MLEVRFHGRGGQGAVTAGELMVNAMNFEGKWAQSFPFFGGERRGAPVMAFLRIDDKRIWLHQQIYEPDCCVVLDHGLVVTIPWYEGMKQGGVAVLNWSESLNDLELPQGLSKIGYVNATEVSTKAFGQRAFPITNTTMLGALAKSTDCVKIESLERAIQSKWSGRLAEMNVTAVKEAYKDTKVLKI